MRCIISPGEEVFLWFNLFKWDFSMYFTSEWEYHLNNKWTNEMNDVCIISWCTLGLNVEAVDWICLFLPWHLLIRGISCIYLSNLLDKWYVPSMLICSFLSLWLELLPNIIKLHLTSFSTQRQSSKKIWNWNNDIRWVNLFHGIWHAHTVSFPCACLSGLYSESFCQILLFY